MTPVASAEAIALSLFDEARCESRLREPDGGSRIDEAYPQSRLREADGASRFGRVGGEPTLGELLAGVWEALVARSTVACPVCDATMHPQYGAHATPVGGRCSGCGSTLS
jgi:hypothetical protein